MKKFIFILGGVKSGKSEYAVKLAKKITKKVAFIATGTPSDKEMEERIKKHKKLRPIFWKLIAEEKNIVSVLEKLNNKYEVVLIDCLGLWISNLMAENLSEKKIEKMVNNLIKTILKLKFTTIVVSNEVGAGIVPANPVARKFRDILGYTNKMMAKKADQVIFTVAGIPIKIK